MPLTWPDHTQLPAPFEPPAASGALGQTSLVGSVTLPGSTQMFPFRLEPMWTGQQLLQADLLGPSVIRLHSHVQLKTAALSGAGVTTQVVNWVMELCSRAMFRTKLDLQATGLRSVLDLILYVEFKAAEIFHAGVPVR